MKQLSIGALAILAMLLLPACTQREPAPPPAEAPAEAALMIGPDGAAGVSTPLPMTVESIAGVAHGYDVAAVQDQIEGDPFTKITLSRGGEVVFEILPTQDQRVHAVTTQSTAARGPAGEVIGRSAFGEAPFAEVVFCRTPLMHEDFSFTCSNAEDGRFWRSYRLASDYEGPVAPFTAIAPDAAVAAILVQMTWIAPRAE